jgi:uncharacterized protein (TIGR04206 family)
MELEIVTGSCRVVVSLLFLPWTVFDNHIRISVSVFFFLNADGCGVEELKLWSFFIRHSSGLPSFFFP